MSVSSSVISMLGSYFAGQGIKPCLSSHFSLFLLLLFCLSSLWHRWSWVLFSSEHILRDKGTLRLLDYQWNWCCQWKQRHILLKWLYPCSSSIIFWWIHSLNPTLAHLSSVTLISANSLVFCNIPSSYSNNTTHAFLNLANIYWPNSACYSPQAISAWYWINLHLHGFALNRCQLLMLRIQGQLKHMSYLWVKYFDRQYFDVNQM